MRIDNRPAFAMVELTGGYTEEKQEETPAGQDELLQQVEADKQAALNELDQTYDGMIDQVDSLYQDQIDASKQWADKQAGLQQEQTDFTIEQIEQEKQQAEKDYLKEQSGAYVDWQKQSSQHGVNAEAMAAQGMSGTGYSESAQVRMYNTYQNRVATAREAIARATLNYDNAIKEAKLQNNAVLAEIAYQAYQQELELALAGFQHKNQLVLEKADRKAAVERQYNSQYLDVLDQINAEDEEQNGVPIDIAPVNLPNDDTPLGGNLFGIVADAGENATMQSVLNLGEGYMSPENLAKLVAEGKVKQTADKNGNVIFEYTELGEKYYLLNQMLPGGVTNWMNAMKKG